jgi:hypothetical protein
MIAIFIYSTITARFGKVRNIANDQETVDIPETSIISDHFGSNLRFDNMAHVLFLVFVLNHFKHFPLYCRRAKIGERSSIMYRFYVSKGLML